MSNLGIKGAPPRGENRDFYAGWHCYRAGMARTEGPTLFGRRAVREWRRGWDAAKKDDA